MPLIDFFVCGNSGGDFTHASWGICKQDLRIALGWLTSGVDGPLDLCGLRLGSTLAADVACDPL